MEDCEGDARDHSNDEGLVQGTGFEHPGTEVCQNIIGEGCLEANQPEQQTHPPVRLSLVEEVLGHGCPAEECTCYGVEAFAAYEEEEEGKVGLAVGVDEPVGYPDGDG